MIVAITAVAWLLNKVLPFKICPICAGVSGTWLLLTFGMLMGNISDASYWDPIALLMGGTVVGIAYQGEKRFGLDGQIYKFRVPVILIGFWLVHFALTHIGWMTFWVDAIVLMFVTFIFFVLPALKRSSAANLEKTNELEKKLSDCC